MDGAVTTDAVMGTNWTLSRRFGIVHPTHDGSAVCIPAVPRETCGWYWFGIMVLFWLLQRCWSRSKQSPAPMKASHGSRASLKSAKLNRNAEVVLEYWVLKV